MFASHLRKATPAWHGSTPATMVLTGGCIGGWRTPGLSRSRSKEAVQPAPTMAGAAARRTASQRKDARGVTATARPRRTAHLRNVRERLQAGAAVTSSAAVLPSTRRPRSPWLGLIDSFRRLGLDSRAAAGRARHEVQVLPINNDNEQV